MEDEIDMVIALNNLDASKRDKLKETYLKRTTEDLADEIVALREQLAAKDARIFVLEIDLGNILDSNKQAEEEIERYKDYVGNNMLMSDFKNIDDMRKEISQLRKALKMAKEKLEIYRKNTNGEYQGGVEFIALMGIIEQALKEL